MWIVRTRIGNLFASNYKPIPVIISGGIRMGWKTDTYPIYEKDNFFQLKPEVFPDTTVEDEPRWIRFVKQEWLLYVNS